MDNNSCVEQILVIARLCFVNNYYISFSIIVLSHCTFISHFGHQYCKNMNTKLLNLLNIKIKHLTPEGNKGLIFSIFFGYNILSPDQFIIWIYVYPIKGNLFNILFIHLQ